MTRRFRRLYGALQPRRRRELLLTLLLLMPASAAAEMLTVAAVLPLLALLSGYRFGPRSRMADLFAILHSTSVSGAVLLLVAAGLAASALRLAVLWMTQRTVNGVGHDLSMAIYGALIRLPYSAHFRRNSNETLAGLEKVQSVASGVLQPMLQAATATILALAIATMLFVIDPAATLIMILVLAAGYTCLGIATHRTLQSHSRTLAATITGRAKLVRESFGSLKDILLDGSQPLFERRFAKADLEMRRGRVVTGFIASAPRLIVEAVALVGVAIIVMLFARRHGGLAAAVPVLGSLAVGAQRLFPLLQQMWFGFAQSRSNAQLVDDVVSLAATRADRIAPDAHPIPLNGKVAFEQVSFGYGDAPLVLRDVSLRIREGQAIGIIGPTGCGKSTFLDLLIGLLDPSSGTIRIGDQVLSAANKANWQASLSHVPQSLYLSDDTVLANIGLGETGSTIDVERAKAAARLAHADGFISQLPQGYATKVGERGVRLSGGERQRLGIARAIYRNRPVLILDEATNALDRSTETAVLKGLAGKGLTMIIVSHRNSSLQICDRLFRLGGGRAVEVRTRQQRERHIGR